jgi:hypothetical protein
MFVDLQYGGSARFMRGAGAAGPAPDKSQIRTDKKPKQMIKRPADLWLNL